MATIFAPHELTGAIRQSADLHIANPTGVRNADVLEAFAGQAYQAAAFASMVGSVVALVVRWRRSRHEEREQLKWLASVAVVMVIGGFLTGPPFIPEGPHLAGSVLFIAAFALGVPLATAIAIFRYRLYEIDVVINRALVYGSLAALITGVYVGIAVGIGELAGSGCRHRIANMQRGHAAPHPWHAR